MQAQQTQNQTYNGWSNYPTWAVNLWLSNDEGLYNEVFEAAKAAKGQETPRVYLADWLADFIAALPEVCAIDVHANMAADIFSWAIGQTDWFEIADAWLEDVSAEVDS